MKSYEHTINLTDEHSASTRSQRFIDNYVSIGLINPKSATNVASILRACSCYGASSVFYTGQRFGYAKEFNADTKRMRHIIPTVGVDDLLAIKPKDAKTVVIELVEDATPLPEFEHPNKAFYIFGPEDASVSPDIVKQADHVVYIPTKNSMNLAATANVVLYDRLAKSDYDASNRFIRQSRDNNNNL
ncbi:RNA methyltransferase [Glaciecola sp. MH2013]|uniref:RNA methyltransferase n=1 Tax=Glaciecola sp. MH2013 TaxID=2785524 RepID=UPI00189F0A2B|nr:RNA methyltransferase [Glaciecola sp. MH2013]MBF7074769.1 RNA methyltransferase [Glaciecola sp. MH2013]